MRRRPRPDRCSHQGYHSWISRYARTERRLLYERRCDDCGARLQIDRGPRYVPSYDPCGRPRKR